MGICEDDSRKRDGEQGFKPRGEDFSPEADSSLLNEELSGLQYILKAFIAIALPVLTCMAVYNILEDRRVEAVLVCSMAFLLLGSSLAIRKFRNQSLAPEEVYRIYQNAIRAFLLIFFAYIIYAAGWKSELDRAQWSYIFPIVAFLCLGKREGFIWVLFFLASMALVLFYPHPEASSPDASFGFKIRYVMSFSVMCAVGFAGKHGIEATYARLVHRQGKLAESRKEYSEAYEGLQISQERLRLIAENAKVVIWMTDMNLRYTYISPYIKHNLDYTPEEYVLKPLHEVLTPSSLELCMQLFDKELEEEKNPDRDLLRSRTIEVEHIHRDGRIIWAELHMTFIRDAAGNAVGILGITGDITERKQAEEVLRKSEAKYRLITEKMNDSVWTSDLELRLTYVSPSDERLYGYTAEERMAQSLGEMLTPASLEKALEILSQELAREATGQDDPYRSVSIELEYYRKDGSTIWVETTVSGIRNDEGVPIGFHGVDRDITERKRIEAELIKSEQKYRHLFEKAEEGILVVRGETIEFANPALARILQRPVDAIIAKPFVSSIHPEDRAIVSERHRRRMLGETVETGYDFRIIAADGDERWLRITSQVIDWEGAPASLSFLTDITDRKRAEEEREKLKEQLDRAHNLESIGTLAGGVAHDFNNLLMGIQGHASLMMLDVDPSHPHHVRLKHIEELVRSGADLTGQILGFARGGRYAARPTDMNDIVEKTANMFGRAKKEIIIHRQYRKDLWSVEADLTQMEQVLMNLYVNAWHAMPGGGEISLETDNVLLNDHGALPLAPGKYVKITVSDTGTGMDEKTRERIFEPFFTTKGMGRGTGLGLATVYGIIKGHGGLIDVISEPGQGTTFEIYLPATEKSVIEEAAAEKKAPGGTETILLVDDEATVMAVARELLEFLGYRVYCAGSGQEVVAIYHDRKDEIDLVILDMIMPGISGAETFDRLREIDPKINVLLSSGYSIDGKAREILERGCNGFLQKPYQLAQLAREVRACLDKEQP
jgi:PAS domain S-box-containing protein